MEKKDEISKTSCNSYEDNLEEKIANASHRQNIACVRRAGSINT